MDRYITINYGLLGGTLDATKHVLAAAPRLLTASELAIAQIANRITLERLSQN